MIIGFARLNISFPFFEEVAAVISNNWQPHYNTSGYEGDWDVLTLRSPGGDADNIFAELIGQNAYADTPLMQNFPSVRKLLDDLPCQIMAARLLNLKAGAIIKQHRDNELAFEKGEARLHFPITTNDKVEFFVNDVRVTMLRGQCWYINANMPHRVANYGDTDRIHLVVDCAVNDALKTIFDHAEKTNFDAPDDTAQTLMVITALRNQQTEAANKLADSMEMELKKQASI